MKKIFKLTLRKKIFIMMFTSFVLINIFNVSMDYQREVTHTYEELDNTEWNAMARDLQSMYFNQNYQFNNQYFEKISQSFDGKVDSVFVLNKDMDIEYHQRENVVPYISCMRQYEDVEVSLNFHISQLSSSQQKQLEDALKQFLDRSDLPIQIASPTLSQLEPNTSMSIDDISYLAIYDNVIFDNRKNNEPIETLPFYMYESKDYLLSASDLYVTESIVINEINYQKMNKDVLENLKARLPEKHIGEEYQIQLEEENTLYNEYHTQFEKDKTLYNIRCFSMIKHGAKENEFGEYSIEDIDGYLVLYTYDYMGIDRIMMQSIFSKTIIYISSLILCFLLSLYLSFLLTKRIKKINQSTLMIADNHFDIQLNERSKDELGELSHNINQMSQRLKQTLQQLNEEIEHVKKLEGMRKEFIAHFTHEIKTPLSIINGYIELIEIGKDEHKKQQYLQAINQEVEHINQLVMAMLDLSRLESGRVQLQIENIDLEDMLTTTVESFAPILKNKHIQVVMDESFPHIQGDKEELQIVFQNFMSNAVKHTPQDGHIYIRYREHILTFENEGKQLTEKQIETIWDRYVSHDRQGTGLGLAICRSILDLHGFTYHVENTQKGVQFQIYMTKNKI